MSMTELELAKFSQNDMVMVIMARDLDKLKEYFVHSELTNNEIYSDLQYNINHAFKVACNNGNLSLVKYLLTSPELDIHADIHCEDDIAIYSACEWGYTHIVDYLLKSTELPENAKLPTQLDDIFEYALIQIKHACEDDEANLDTYSAFEDYLSFIEYLIFEININSNPGIITVLQENTPKSFWEPAINKLAKNELFNCLDKTLSNSKQTNKKVKL